jgi:hypothetical protein
MINEWAFYQSLYRYFITVVYLLTWEHGSSACKIDLNHTTIVSNRLAESQIEVSSILAINGSNLYFHQFTLYRPHGTEDRWERLQNIHTLNVRNLPKFFNVYTNSNFYTITNFQNSDIVLLLKNLKYQIIVHHKIQIHQIIIWFWVKLHRLCSWVGWSSHFLSMLNQIRVSN